MVALVDGCQSVFDFSYFIGAEFMSVVEAVTQLVFLLDGRRLDAFACCVPSFAFLNNGQCGFLAGTYDSLTKIGVTHVLGSECQ